MPVLLLTPAFINNSLTCPPGKGRVEYCDSEVPGLYVEVRSTGAGHGTYYLRYKDNTGKTCHQKIDRTGDITLPEARKKARQLKAEIHLGADPRAADKAHRAVPTMTTFFDEQYLPYVKPRKRSWVDDVSRFRNRVEPEFGNVRLNEIKRQKVQAFHAGLLDTGISPATADHHVKLIRHMLNLAVEWEILEVNPIARIKLFNPDNRVENYLGEEDLGRLLGVLRTDSNRAVCNVALFLLSTGARLNEGVTARWEQFDMAGKVWRIPAKTSKSKKIRPVPLNDAAMDVLRGLVAGLRDRARERGDPNADTFEPAPTDRLFISERTGEPLTWVQKVWDRLRREAGLPQLRMHDLRHQFASFLVNDGRTLYEVQKILGHSSHSVTERYAHLSTKSLLDAANSASARIRENSASPTHPTAPNPA